MKSKKEIRLYNVLFPIWMLLIIPTAWIAVLPANFIVDSLVLLITAKKIGILEKGIYKKHILRVWIFGFIADLIGAGILLGSLYIFEDFFRGDELTLTLPAMLVSAVMIFLFNYRFSFSDIDKRSRLKMALSFAIFTAPYTFLIPISWIYS